MDEQTVQFQTTDPSDAHLGAELGEVIRYQLQIQPPELAGWVDFGMPNDDGDAVERSADHRVAKFPGERVRIVEELTTKRVVYLDGESVE